MRVGLAGQSNQHDAALSIFAAREFLGEVLPDAVARSAAEPFQPTGGLRVLTGNLGRPKFKHLIIAPFDLSRRIVDLIDAETSAAAAGRKAIMGALTLYLDFINLFLFLLRLFGRRR